MSNDRYVVMESAMKRLDSAVSPRGIIDAAARVQLTIDRMKADAKLTGEPIALELFARMRAVEAAVAAAAPRAQRLAETIAGIAKHAQLAADAYMGKGVA